MSILSIDGKAAKEAAKEAAKGTARTEAPRAGLLDGYRPPEGVIDEMLGPDGQVRPH